MVADKHTSNKNGQGSNSKKSGHAAELRIDRTPEASTLLVVDDSEFNRDLLSRRLIHYGYNVATAEGGAEAIECIQKSDYDAILLDIMMPEVSGWDVLEWIRASYSREQLPVIMATANDASEDMVKALQLGANDYVTKPLDVKVVRARVDTHVILKKTAASLIRTNQQLEELARFDSLTSVLNRRSFEEYLDREFKRAMRYKSQLSCIVMDIDFFKRVNDTYGHAAGDQVLIEVAKVLSDNSRETDFVARYGGEEFCVLLTETSETGGVNWAERVRQEVAKLIIQNESAPISVTLSLGVASLNDGMKQPQEMIQLADEAMFTAKQRGRNQVVCHADQHQESATDAGIWKEVPVSQLMYPIDHSLHVNQSIRTAILAMSKNRLDSLPVLNDAGELAGIIEEDDIVDAMLQSESVNRPVANLMKTQVPQYQIDTPAREVCEFLSRGTVRQIYIFDQDRLAGAVRRKEFVEWFGEHGSAVKIPVQPIADILNSNQNALTTPISIPGT